MDVESILIKAGIDYDKKGDRLWVQCAEHDDHDCHNEYIYASSGIYWCYACHATGNLNKFLQVRGKSLADLASKDEIKEFANQKIEHKVRDLDSVEIKMIKGKIEDVYSNMEVYSYCKSLYMIDSFIDKYEISYTKFAQFEASDCMDRKPTTFIKRLLFPVYEKNRLVSVGGRDYTLKQTPKELYPLGAIINQPYNWENIDLCKPVIDNEGWKNLVQLYNITSNVISNFGTSSYKGKEDSSTWEVMPKTKKLFEIPRLIKFLDNDEAGYNYAIAFQKMYEFYGKGQVRYVQDYRVHDNGKGYDAHDCSKQELKEILHVKNNGDIDFDSLPTFDEWYSGAEIKELYAKKDYDSFL